MVSAGERSRRDRRFGEIVGGSRLPCVVTVQEDDGICEPRFEGRGRPRLHVRSPVDVEDALTGLRRELERRGLLLLGNRFRRDAFVSSMARQMSAGLACCLVSPGRPVDPERIVDSLGPAPREAVVPEAEAAAYIRSWLAGFGG